MGVFLVTEGQALGDSLLVLLLMSRLLWYGLVFDHAVNDMVGLKIDHKVLVYPARDRWGTFGFLPADGLPELCFNNALMHT